MQTIDNPMLRPSIAERSAEQLASVEDGMRELMRIVFVQALTSNADILISTGNGAERKTPAYFLADVTMRSAELLRNACREAQRHGGSDEVAMGMLREFIRSVADEYADDIVEAGL